MKIVAVGDIGWDSFLELNPADVAVHCNLNTHQCEICFKYGEKIPVAGLTRAPGGNAANAAVGLARLGHAVWLYAQVGDDETGHQLLAQLANESVELSSVATDTEELTNSSTVINYRGERTIFSYHHPRRYHTDHPVVSPDLLYLTSLGEGWEKVYQQVLAAYAGVKLVVQPGTRQIRGGAARLKPFLAAATALILNLEEATELVGGQLTEHQELLHALLDLGPQAVVITDARRGAYLSDGVNFLHLGAVESAPRRELTGVGDAFAVGFVHGWLAAGKELADAGRWGAVSAASVMQFTGAQRGLLAAGELLRQAKQSMVSCERL